MDDQFAEINGHRLRYQIQGHGPLAVIGHGLLGSIEQITEQFGVGVSLAGRLRLLTYDARGHGQSEGPRDPAGYTWEALGLDMLELATRCGEERAVYGGGSMGAATALWLAVERPRVVRGLVLVMPPPLGGRGLQGEDERQAIQLLDFLTAAMGAYGLEKTVELARLIPGFASTPEAAEQRARWLREQNPLALSYAMRGLLDAPFHDPERYRAIRAPALVIGHEGDGLHPVRSARLLADAIEGSRLVVAPSPDYWESHPEELLGEIGAFLAAVG